MTRKPAGSAGITRPVGHDAILERLERLSLHVRHPDAAGSPTDGPQLEVAHAWLMVGPEGVGKFHTALWWTTRLKCAAQRPTDRACTCPSCLQIAALAHPDLRVVEPAEPGKAIGIEDVRELIHAMGLKPRDPGPRIAIVREAQLLTVHAQSAMLKLLEEPPGFSVIILVTENLASILPTIRSRCQTLRFGPLPADAVGNLLVGQGRTAEFAGRVAALSQGSAGRACAFTPEAIDDRQALLTAYESFHTGGSPLIAELVDDLVQRHKDARCGLDTLLEWQMRKVEAAFGYGGDGESGTLAEILANVRESDARRLLEEAHRIHAAIGALERNANASLAIRDLLLDLRPS